MNFTGSGIRLDGGDYERAATTIGCDTSAIRAVVTVEAAGSGFDDKNRLKILPEPHVFYRVLPAGKRSDAVQAGLAYPKWGEQPYDKTQDARYARLYKMIAIDQESALKSTSFGLPQTMGFNFGVCGFPSVTKMVDEYMRSEGRQLDGMVGFIIGAGLGKALRDRDWRKFAAGYNGPAYEQNQYDAKLKRTYERFEGFTSVAADPWSDGLLSMGDVGAAVSELQLVLTKSGFGTGGTDGQFGKLTDQAVRQYQAAKKLTADGKVGPNTAKALGLKWAA